LPADVTAQAGRDVGMQTEQADDVAQALGRIVATDPQARILICGSLYLAGNILRGNG